MNIPRRLMLDGSRVSNSKRRVIKSVPGITSGSWAMVRVHGLMDLLDVTGARGGIAKGFPTTISA